MKNINIGYVYLLLSQVIWGVLPAFWRLMRDLPSFYTLSTRIVWASIFCFLLIWQKNLLPGFTNIFHNRKQLPYIIGACLIITVNWGAFIYATTRGFILQSSLAYYINPIVVIFFGRIFFHEHISNLQKIALVFATTGLVIAFFLYGEVPYLALLICLSWSLYTMFKKKIVLDSQVSVFIESASMVPFALAFIFFCEWEGTGAMATLHGWQWLLLPATGVVTAVPMMLFTAGVKRVPMTVSGILMYCSPSITLVIALLVGEEVSQAMLITFIFAWIGVAFYLLGIYRTMQKLKVHAD